MKFMLKKKVRGSISLLLVAILLPTMLFSALMVDISRLNLAKSMVSSAGDVALNSALANYDTVLKDVYGLFSITQTDEDWEEHIRRYFEETLVGQGVVSEEDAGDYVSMLLGNLAEYLVTDGNTPVNFLDMSIDGFTANGVEGSSLSESEIMKKQIVEYMKYRGPYEFGMSFLDGLKAFEKVEDQSSVVEVKVKTQEKTQDVSDACRELYKNISAYDTEYDDKEESSGNPKNTFSGSNNKVYELDSRVDSYKAAWKLDGKEMDYVKINRLIVEFDLTAYTGQKPEVTINTEVNKQDSSGYTSYSDAKGAFNGGINKALNSSLKEKFAAKKFFDPYQINEVNEFTDVFKADEQFKEYEKYLRNKNSGSPVNRENLINEVSNFNNLTKALGAFYYWSDKKIRECEKNIATAEANQASYNTEKSEKESLLNTIKSETLPAAGKELEDAENGCSSKSRSIYLSYLNDYKNTTDENKKYAFKTEVNNLDGIYKNDVDREKIVKCIEKFDVYKALEVQRDTLDKEIRTLGDNISQCQINISTNQAEKEELQQDQKNMQEQYDKAKEKYTGLDTLVANANKAYDAYKASAKNTANTMVKAINTDIKKVQKKLELLQELLKTAISQCDKVTEQIDLYMKELDKWNTSVSEYESANDKDSFSANNTSEINELKKSYKKEDVTELKKYLEKEYNILEDYLKFFKDKNNFKFGSEKITDITEYAMARKAIEKSKTYNTEVKGKDGLDSKQLGDFFGHIYSTTSTPEGHNTNINTVLPESSNIRTPLCRFAAFLKETYGSEKKDETVEATYEEMKSGAKSDGESKSKGETKLDSDSSNKYGYTYEKITESLLNGMSLPSTGKSSSVSGGKADSDNASDSYSSQKSIASQILGKITKILEEGRDDLYVLGYIFGNFSYATIVQDIAEETADAAELKNIVAETFSGYKINAANNYMYGAEIEYILYGNKTPKNNVASAKATIFAIRFICNSIFAFSDSEIRATTEAAGLAVQAATAGFVPYQIVQIAMQFSLALAESAIDLEEMMAGKKVVVMKTRDTWNMSISGIGRKALEAAKDKVKDTLNQAINKLTEQVQNGIAEFIDSTADEISKKSGELVSSVTDATKGMAYEVTDRMFGTMREIIIDKLNGLLYLEEEAYENLTVFKQKVDTAFADIRNEVSKIGQNFDSTVAEAVWEEVEAKLLEVVNEADSTFTAEFNSLYGTADEIRNQISAKIYSAINKTKDKVSEKISEKIIGLSTAIEDKTQTVIRDYEAKVKNLAQNKTEEARAEILNETNKFVDEAFGKISTSSSTTGLNNATNLKKSSSLKDAIKFGYKDYLMMFVFVGLVANEKDTIERVGDVIQMNIMNAKKGTSQFYHLAGEGFRLNKSYTYVSVTANMDFGMLVLDAPFFQKAIESLNEDIESGLIADGTVIDLDDGNQTIKYTGLAGY